MTLVVMENGKEAQLIAILRRTVLAGSLREINPDEPLGESGVGLDSLALVSFVTAVEQRFGVPLPDAIWADRDRLTLRTLVEALEPSRAELPVADDERVVAPPPAAPALMERFDADHPDLAAPARRDPFLVRAGRRALWTFYRRTRSILLACDLANEQIPRIPTPPGIRLGEVFPRDRAALAGLASQYRHAERREELSSGFERGWFALGAWHGERLVAIDWLSPTGEDLLKTGGLKVRTRPGCCYGFGLRTDPEFSNRGVGLALLAWSLEESRRRGFTAQATLVHSANRRMIGVSTRLLRFRPIGEIEVRRFLGRYRATWRVGDQRGVGGTVYVG